MKQDKKTGVTMHKALEVFNRASIGDLVTEQRETNSLLMESKAKGVQVEKKGTHFNLVVRGMAIPIDEEELKALNNEVTRELEEVEPDLIDEMVKYDDLWRERRELRTRHEDELAKHRAEVEEIDKKINNQYEYLIKIMEEK